MNAVAICAGRRQLISAGEAQPVDALQKNMLDLAMTFSASCGDIELVNRRAGIVRRQNLVLPMAIRADGSALGAFLDRSSMHAILIRREDPRADAACIHHKLLAVAAAACRRNVGVIDG